MSNNRWVLAFLCVPCFLTAGLPRASACTFRRGDANLDGGVDISDPVRVLNILFLGSEKPACDDLLDGNDDGAVDISDGVYLLAFLFLGGPDPPAPFPGCGPDETPDALGCAAYFACSPTCVDPGAVIEGLSVLAALGACVPTGMAPIQAGPAELIILPAARAKPCGTPPAPGWPIQLTTAAGSIDLPGRTARVHVEGTIVDLPVVVDSFLPDVECAVDIAFDGDAVLQLELLEREGKLYFTGLRDVNLQDVNVDVSATGGLACNIGEFLVGFVQDFVLDAIVDSIRPQLVSLADGLGCRAICTGP